MAWVEIRSYQELLVILLSSSLRVPQHIAKPLIISIVKETFDRQQSPGIIKKLSYPFKVYLP